MKVATRPDLFPCSEVISWILPREDVTTMILANTAKQRYASYSLGYVSLAYHLPPAQVYLTEDWLKEINLVLDQQILRNAVSHSAVSVQLLEDQLR